LEHILRACPELESPRRRNFVQVPPPLTVMSTDQVARFFREVFEWEPQDRSPPTNKQTNKQTIVIIFPIVVTIIFPIIVIIPIFTTTVILINSFFRWRF
jgi:hypothetical protein